MCDHSKLLDAHPWLIFAGEAEDPAVLNTECQARDRDHHLSNGRSHRQARPCSHMLPMSQGRCLGAPVVEHWPCCEKGGSPPISAPAESTRLAEIEA